MFFPELGAITCAFKLEFSCSMTLHKSIDNIYLETMSSEIQKVVSI